MLNRTQLNFATQQYGIECVCEKKKQKKKGTLIEVFLRHSGKCLE